MKDSERMTQGHGMVRYGTRCYFNVRSKADMSQLNLPHDVVIIVTVPTLEQVYNILH